MLVQLLIIQIGVFAALIIVLRVLFYRNFNSALRRLKELQEQTLLKEAHLDEELARARREKEAEIERGRKEAKSLIGEAKREGENLQNSAREDAEKERRKILEKGSIELKKRQENMEKEIEARAIGASLEMIKYAFTDKGEESLQRQLLDEIIEEIRKIDREKFSVKTDKAKLITSLPLKEKEKDDLKKLLSEKVSREIHLEEEVDKTIIAGLIIKMGEFVIDGSLRNKLEKAITYLRSTKQHE